MHALSLSLMWEPISEQRTDIRLFVSMKEPISQQLMGLIAPRKSHFFNINDRDYYD